MAKIALLIGISEYEPGLNPLPAAVKDVEAMGRVLVHPEMGNFAASDIVVLTNPKRQEMEDAIYDLFADRTKDDLLLFYFSGHGMTDKLGQLYLATRLTRQNSAKQLIDVTAVSASLLHQKMTNSRSEQQIVILDCCFSGAFAKGMNAKSDGTVNIQNQLGGKGRAVLASSTATQYSFEHKDSGFSIYTHYLQEGIHQGKADGDSDGWISIDELHQYASDRVVKYCLENEISPPMTPEIYAVKEGYKIHLAKAPIVDGKLRYRQEAKNRFVGGKFSPPALRILKARRFELGLSEDEAETILKELVLPYQEYEEALIEAVDREYPFKQRTQKDLKDYQQMLGLNDEDIAEIEARVIDLIEAENERKRKQAEQERQETERLQQQQEAEKRQQELERLKQQQIATPPPTPNSPSGIKTQSFEFEIATLFPVKQREWFSGEKVTYDIKCSRKRAEFFTEDLGNGVKLEMVAIPGGTFLMGSPDNEPERLNNEGPQHSVTIRPFFLGKFPITQAQWQAVAGFPKVKIDLNPDQSDFKGANRPVETVFWDEAIEFCARLSQKTRRMYRLPSEAEWEYACRAGTTTPFHFGDTMTTDLANYRGKDETINQILYKGSYGNGPKGIYRRQTTDVGSFPANAFGLYDMHGNVWEWCADYWHESYNGAPTDGSVWLTEDETAYRLLRGGAWYLNPWYCRSARRVRDLSFDRNRYISFRVGCVPARGLPSP